MYLRNKFFLILLFIISCQPVEILKPIEIDYSQLETIYINAKEVKINVKYVSTFTEQNIEDQIKSPPIKIIRNWIDRNVKIFGNQNKLIINILEASISKKEIENLDANKYEEKTIFQYEIFYLAEYELFDDNDYLLANTTVEVSRSTTSKKYISLNEKEIITNDLMFSSILDFANESKTMIKTYMSEYLN